MSPEDAACEVLAAHCVCRGSRVLHIGTTPVPCPDCGDV